MIKIRNRFNANILLEIESLRGANLRGADLCGANLREADLRGQNITLIQGTKHFLQHYDNMIRIECKYYTVPEWIKNYKDVGKKYEYTDTEIEEYGRYIKMIAGKCNIEV